MKVRNLAVSGVLLLALAGCAAQAEAEDVALETDEDKTFYALGLVISRNLSSFNLNEQELAKIQAGIADGALGREHRVDVQAYAAKIDPLLKGRMQAVAKEQQEAGEAQLAKAAQEPGAVKTPSGLVYREVSPGEGPNPGPTDTVNVHYTGTLPDGTVFDTSRKGDDPQPVPFPLNRVVPCFTEGLQKMKAGGKSVLTCPPDLAYGDRGSPPAVPPGATLTFEVELVAIQGGASSSPTP